MMYTVDSTTATSATLPNLQCNTEYTIWVYARGGLHNKMSVPRMISLPARGMYIFSNLIYIMFVLIKQYCRTPPAPPTPTEVTAQFISASSVRVTWQWTSSQSAPDCFNTTAVTYHPEGGGESSLQLSDPAANETTLTDLQCNTNYTITVVATAGENMSEGSVFLQLQGKPQFYILSNGT